MAMGGRSPEEGDELGGVFAEINITPLTDIFLVLLIIFMVGASMAVDAAGASRGGEATGGVKIDLPKGSAKDLSPRTEDVAVAILADGRVLVEGAETRAEELRERLAAALGDRTDATLIVQADEGVPHGRVVQVMEEARAAGFARLAVATRR
jgi:biopolymer transport protein ExbD